MDFYIYYRVPVAQAKELCAKVAAMQKQLGREFGVVTGLKRRSEEKQEQQTWMEIYFAVPDGFEAALEQHVKAAGLDALIEGERHIEYFQDLYPCA